MKKTISTTLALGMLAATFALAGGHPSDLNAGKRGLPYKLKESKDHSVILTEKREILHLFQDDNTDLADEHCIQNLFKLPGHAARLAAGYHVESVYLSKGPDVLSISLNYELADGTDGLHFNGSSNGYPSVMHTCKLKWTFPSNFMSF